MLGVLERLEVGAVSVPMCNLDAPNSCLQSSIACWCDPAMRDEPATRDERKRQGDELISLLGCYVIIPLWWNMWNWCYDETFNKPYASVFFLISGYS